MHPCATNGRVWNRLFCSAPYGDFQSILEDDMVPFEQDVVNFLKQILEALGFIHERNIAHMDLKVGTNSCVFSVL